MAKYSERFERIRAAVFDGQSGIGYEDARWLLTRYVDCRSRLKRHVRSAHEAKQALAGTSPHDRRDDDDATPE